MDQGKFLVEQLHHVLPLDRLIHDLHADLDEHIAEKAPIQLETGIIEVPKNVEIEEIAKVMQFDCIENVCSFRAIIAVGGIKKYSNGVVTPRYCFARLHYNDKLELVTIDYYDSYAR